jgi:hypothetical protein
MKTPKEQHIELMTGKTIEEWESNNKIMKKMKDLHIDTLKSVGVTQIIPDDWKNWIWTELSDGAPFSWGDNNHSLVDAFGFGDHLDSILDSQDEELQETIKEHRPAITDTLNYLFNHNIYVDLEE